MRKRGVDVIENSEILVEWNDWCSCLLLLWEVEKGVEGGGVVPPITNMGGAVQSGNSKTNKI